VRGVFDGWAAPADVVAYVQATDYGLTNDAFCVGTVAMDRAGRYWVVEDFALAGRPGEPASIETAEAEMLRVAKARRLECTRFDPWQAASTMQRHGAALTAREFDFRSMANRRAMAKVLREAVKGGRLKARPGAFRRKHANGQSYDLERELLEAIAIQKDAGEVIDHPPGGHNDAIVVVGMAVVTLAEIPVMSDVSVTPKGGAMPWHQRRRVIPR
jgi:hypothetical protein